MLFARLAGRAPRSALETRIPKTLYPNRATRTTTISLQKPSLSTTATTTTPKHHSSTHHNATQFPPSRPFTTTPTRPRQTIGQLKARYSNGPFSWKAALLLILTGAGMIVYFRHEKERLARKRIAELSKGVGKPKVGGPFVLKDLGGNTFTEEDLRGRYSFVSIFLLHMFFHLGGLFGERMLV